MPTGFTDLDRLLGGLNKSDLIIVAARPGMGKCVTADTRLLHPHTGELIDIETLVKRQHAALLTLGNDYKLRPGKASRFVDSGIKPVFRVQTRLGREIKTTLSHPFLTIHGWKPLFDLAVGDRVGVPRRLPVFGQDDANDHEAKLLAYLLADGSMRGTTPQFSNSNPLLRDDFTAAALMFSGNKATVYDSRGQRVPTVHITQDAAFVGEDREQFAGVLAQVMETAVFSTTQLAQPIDVPYATVAQWRSGKNFPSPANFQKLCAALDVNETELLPNGHAHNSQIDNTLTRWLKEQGVWGKAAAEKTIPDAVYRYSKRKLALFLNRLFACDGSVYVQGEGQTAVSYATVSPQLARGVQHLLLRFGILAKLRHRHVTYQGNPRPVYELRLTDGESILTFVQEIGALGREGAIETACANLQNTACTSKGDVFWDEIVVIEPLGEQQVYDLTVPETHNFVAEDMIVHNTSLQNAIALTAARRHGKRVAMFNLEMSGEQLVQRMIAAETRIDSQRLRRGDLHDHEWPIFMEAIGRLSETRIFIDDTPSITPAQLRTKCRRLYAEHGLDLVMIDYLQLMQAERPTNNRVQEISEISRGLKTLARELDVPVVAAAQLSRAVEQRQDKRPLLSDLRDSGCLTGDTLITLAETGQRVPIRSLVGQAGFSVWALNEETMKLETAVVSNAFATGTKPVYRLTTKLGRTIRATANHKFRTFTGWKRLDQIQNDDHVAVPRLLPTSSVQTMSNDELALLGYLIGDGCTLTLPRHVIQYTTREPDLGDHVVRLAKTVFADDVEPRMQQERTWYQVYLSSTRRHTHGVRSAVTEWLDSLGIFGLRSHQKRVPETVFMQPQKAIAWFLRHLWATDGCIKLQRNPKGFTPVIYYATSSVQLATDVQSLLLRLHITARVKCVPQGEKGRDQYHVVVTGKPDVVQFMECIGAVGEYKSRALAEIQEYVAELKPNTNRDVIPSSVWRTFVVPAMQTNGITSRELQARINQTYCGTSLYQQNVSRERAARVADAVSCDTVSKLAQSDIYWDQIISIEYDGEEEVFDLTVPGLHNFVANDITVHNSIEQDSDIVMFIYRDEYYHAETTERPNIAEIVVAKHRNGPTGTVDLFWHGKLATFRNLQRQEIDL
ncbi:MAG: replicative DNA helicase [Anaerolineales bacterium]|nr:replicative DNA helicase [Anaerolineales bacterium]